MSSKVTITFQNIKAEITYAQPQGLLAYQNIQMVDVRLDPDSLNQYFADSFGFSDAPVFTYNKAVADSVGIADAPVINVGKALADSVSMSDSFSPLLNIIRTFSDSVSMGDSISPLLTIGLPLSDAFTVDEVFDSQTVQSILKQNVVGISDVLTTSVGKALADSANISDQLTVNFALNSLADGVSVAESLSINYVSGTLSLLNNSTMNTATFNG